MSAPALVGADGGDPIVDEDGYHADHVRRFNGQTDFIELVLVIDMGALSIILGY